MKFYLIAFVLLSGCASAKAKTCPSVSEEPISTCRAEVACGKGKASTAVGAFFGGFSAGMNHQSNTAVDNYNLCIDRDLDAQKTNASYAAETASAQRDAQISEKKNPPIDSNYKLEVRYPNNEVQVFTVPLEEKAMHIALHKSKWRCLVNAVSIEKDMKQGTIDCSKGDSDVATWSLCAEGVPSNIVLSLSEPNKKSTLLFLKCNMK